MKNKMICLLLAVCLLSGCGSPAAMEPEADAYTFTDDLGRTVKVESCDRVAALLGSFAQVWMIAGGSICATADDAWDDFNLALPEKTVNLGNTKQLSLELLLASEPDLVLASTNTKQNLEWRETLEAAGITVAYFNVADFGDYLRMLDICTDLTGRKDLYEEKGLAVQAQIDEVLARSEDRVAESGAPTVLCMRASASSITVKNSEDNVLGEMLAALGCVNIADSDASLLENLSIERILEADPDYIFIVQRGDDTAGMKEHVNNLLESDPAWGSLTAVREGRVYFMDKMLYNLKPNDRWGEAYQGLEEILNG